MTQTTHMAREIAEQPDAVRRTLAALLPVRDELRGLARGRRRVLLAARGSSDNAALYGRYLLEVHAGWSAGLVAPSVATHYRSRLDLSYCLVVSVSQSGSTREIVETQAWARGCGAATVAVTNVADSPLAAGADLALVTQAGEEVAVPATKTYLTQLVAMSVVADALGAPVAALLERVPDKVDHLLGLDVSAAARTLADARDVVVSGRGLLMGTALETALKLEETCLRPVRGYSYADLRHGPISVVSDGVVAVLVAAADGPLAEPMVELAADLGSRGARILGIGGSPTFAAACDEHLPGGDLPEPVVPLTSIVPAQLVVERLARDLALDPDNPRGLAKVTQTDTSG
jgi:glucosamine--fructose-6-phosphate aminotransferase (isomerizing)